MSATINLPAEIFKAYDIRGIVGKSLTAEVVRRIGHALGSPAVEHGQTAIAVGRDGRLSGPELAGALTDGICACLLYTSPSPRDRTRYRMPSSA